MSRLAIVELHKEELKFSAGHFMIFSAMHRETMHGHDYQVSAAFHTLIQSNGMSFDVRSYKHKISQLCQALDFRFMLPSLSEHLRLEDAGDKWLVHFAKETISLLKKDTVVLPVCNITLEELSNWFLQQLIQNTAELKEHLIQGIVVKVFNGRGESGATLWGKTALDSLQLTNGKLAQEA